MGLKASCRSYAYFLRNTFEDDNLIDVTPSILVPTWSNGQVGKAGIVKRLAHFLMDEYLSRYIGRYRIWLVFSRISNNKPTIL